MSRTKLIRIVIAVVVAIIVLVLVRMHLAAGQVALIGPIAVS